VGCAHKYIIEYTIIEIAKKINAAGYQLSFFYFVKNDERKGEKEQ